MNDDLPKSDKFTMGDLMDPEHPRREELIARVTHFFQENKELSRTLSEGFNAFSRVVDRIAPAALQIFSDTALLMKKAHEDRQIIYPKIVDNLDFLASQCWFLSMEVSLVDFEQQALILESIPDYQNRADLVDESFVAFYKEYLPHLSTSIVEAFPERAFAIKPAIDAHNRGEFALSIPVFFAQSDGILLALTERELFTSKGHISDWAREKISSNPESETWINLIDTSAWKPLSSQRPVGWTKGSRNENAYTGLNRHTTLHGLDLEYATEVNSYKAFSLLAHVASLGGVLESSEELKAFGNDES